MDRLVVSEGLCGAVWFIIRSIGILVPQEKVEANSLLARIRQYMTIGFVRQTTTRGEVLRDEEVNSGDCWHTNSLQMERIFIDPYPFQQPFFVKHLVTTAFFCRDSQLV